jgi:hypothetical protein
MKVQKTKCNVLFDYFNGWPIYIIYKPLKVKLQKYTYIEINFSSEYQYLNY